MTTTVQHSALDSATGRVLEEAPLTDRQRIAVLLQAGSLLSHLETAGFRLTRVWEGARIDEQGLLRGVAAEEGRFSELPQQLLTGLAGRLFRADEYVAGRGEGRRVARQLLSRWSQTLTALRPDDAVQQLLDEAAFLWEDGFGAARTALVAVHERNGASKPWVAGPGWFRESVLRGGATLAEITECLAAGNARTLWLGGGDENPAELLARGRYRGAVRAWLRRPERDAAERVRLGRALFGLGRFESALGELARLRSTESRILRAACLSRLGRLKAADRELRRFESIDLGVGDGLEAAAVAVRLYANAADRERAQAWVVRADGLARRSGEAERWQADLIGFSAAWDRGDRKEMSRRLAAAAPARDDAALGWRWNRAAGLEAIDRGDGVGAVGFLTRGLGSAGRWLSPTDRGSLWNELAIARSIAGDLAGAERALLHVLHLHRESEGPRRTTLTLFNLAEVRLRRGRLQGVEEILRQSALENRQSGNWRGMVHDTELWARFEMVRGKPATAVERIFAAIEQFDQRAVDWRRPELNALAARALGWLGRADEALEALETAGTVGLQVFEAEERGPLFALAGDRERALEALGEGPHRELGVALLTGRRPSDRAWTGLAELDDYRAARFIFDLQAVEPGFTPPDRCRWAAAVLRRSGAGAMAERLEHRDDGPWAALAEFLSSPQRDLLALERLFDTVGYSEARLTRKIRKAQESGELAGDGEVLLDRPGGGEQLTVYHRGVQILIEAPWIDSGLKTMALVAAETMSAGVREAAGDDPADGGEAALGPIVGRAPSLLKTLDRLERLAGEPVPVLLLGETGTGKELMAELVHQRSSRSSGPFVVINCAAVAEELLMSDLFGHVRGSFTGAVRDRIGVFESARAGTVFLDEIGDLPLRAQGFLLRVLQEGEVRRVGESLPRKTDVRVITATHRDLEAMVREGSFRADLFFRLKVASIELPPLRDRGSDVVLLANYFLRRLRPDRTVRLSAPAESALLGYSWPGNIRELENILSVAVALADQDVLLPEHLDLPYPSIAPVLGYHEKVRNFRRRLVREALVSSDGNSAAAARQLGLTRQALSYLVRKLEIET